MALNFRQFFDTVESARNGGGGGTPASQPQQGGFNSIFRPQPHQFSGASYGAARSARQGGITPGVLPEKPAGFKA